MESFHLAVEGNLASGKTTILQKLAESFMKKGVQLEIIPEPIEKWTQYGKSKVNVLEKMYKEPNSSFIFQQIASLTKVQQFKDHKSEYKLVERTLSAQQRVFMPILKEDNKVSDLELEVMSEWIDFLNTLPQSTPDVIIYLQTTPEAVCERIAKRARKEEDVVSLAYLTRIHQQYEKWLLKEHRYPVIVVEADKIQDVDPDDICSRVLLMHQSIYV